MTKPTRREHDLLGERDLPADVYWGIHTLRALENYPITGKTIGTYPDLVRALAYIKKLLPKQTTSWDNSQKKLPK